MYVSASPPNYHRVADHVIAPVSERTRARRVRIEKMCRPFHRARLPGSSFSKMVSDYALHCCTRCGRFVQLPRTAENCRL